MEELKMLCAQCMAYLDQLKIRYGTVSSLKINARAVRRFGRCRKLPDGTYEIEISSRLLDPSVDPSYARDTMIHELLHTCRGCMNHGTRWKRYVNRVNDRFGFQISDSPYKETERSRQRSSEVPSPVRTPSYVFRCSGCGIQILRYRASEFTRNYHRYACGKCGGRFVLMEGADGK